MVENDFLALQVTCRFIHKFIHRFDDLFQLRPTSLLPVNERSVLLVVG